MRIVLLLAAALWASAARADELLLSSFTNRNFDYTYTTAGGLERDTVSDDNLQFALLFYPAMNFNFRLLFDPKSDTNIVFEDERQFRVSGGHEYTLAIEYNF